MSNEILIADLSAARNRLRVSGTDRVDFLHGRLRVGESCYAAFLGRAWTPSGRAFPAKLL